MLIRALGPLAKGSNEQHSWQRRLVGGGFFAADNELHAPYIRVTIGSVMVRLLAFVSLLLLTGVSRAQSAAPPDEVAPAPAPPTAHRTLLMLGPTVLLADDDRTYFGADWAMGRLVSSRLVIGGTLGIGGRRAVATAYGYQATAPAVGIYSLEFSTRYALANTPQYRFELLNGLGYGAVGLFDRDRMVATTTTTRNGSTTTSYQPARVALNEQLLLETGFAATGKLGHGAWLTAQFSRRQLLGSCTFGPAAGFSHWACSVGVSLPYDW
jgi:hypothetical protein